MSLGNRGEWMWTTRRRATDRTAPCARRNAVIWFDMNKRYSILLLISGTGWFLVAGVVGYAIPVFGRMWFQHLLCAIFTAFVVGIAFRAPILSWSGWRWYVLPLLTLLTGTAVFGILLTCSWALTESLDREAFYKLPLGIVFYSMTSCLPVLYPLALLTQHLLRNRLKMPTANSAADGSHPSAQTSSLTPGAGGSLP